MTDIQLQCKRRKPKRCEYRWTYTGNAEWVTSCPKCKNTVTVKKATRDVNA